MKAMRLMVAGIAGGTVVSPLTHVTGVGQVQTYGEHVYVITHDARADSLMPLAGLVKTGWQADTLIFINHLKF